MKVGVIGGGFKPPHKGHFAFAKKAIEKVPDLDKLIIYVGAAPSGTKDRPGFPMTQKQSVDIWKLYAKHLPGTVEIVPARKPPIGEIYSFATKNQDKEVQWFLGVRNEDDMKDVADRQSHLKKNPEKYSNLNVVVIDDTGSDVSGTALRKALDNKDKELAFTMLPDEVDKEAVYDIFMDSPENRMAEVIDGLFEGITNIDEGSGGVPIDAIGAVPSKDKADMDHRFKYFMNLTPPDMTISRRGMEIVITLDKYAEGPQPEAEDLTPTQNPLPESVEDSKFNFTPYIASILEYCIDRELKVTPLPEITVKYDPDNAENLFGRTGYYDPSNSTIAVFASGRHPKDVLRSFCHELIHHMQNLEGKDLMFTTSNVHADDRLKEIEEEAHSKGSMLFREWENSNKEQQPIDEIGDLSQAPYKWKTLTKPEGSDDPYTYYDFSTDNGIKYQVIFNREEFGKTVNYDMSFVAKGKGDKEFSTDILTGGNEPLKIMSTIVDITRDQIKKAGDVEFITFKPTRGKTGEEGAKENPRSKLYKVIIKKNFPKAKVSGTDTVVVDMTAYSNSDLNEVGDASAKAYKWTREQQQVNSDDLTVDYRFKTDKGIEYTAYFTDYEKTGIYYFGFFTDKKKEDQFGSEVTNEGAPLQVMATVVEIMKDFLSALPNTGIRYYADDNYDGDKRRAKLYKAYIEKHLPSNYRVINVTDLYVEILPKEGIKKKELTEKRGRLNPITNRITSIIFNIIKQTHAKGKTLDHTLMVGPYEDADITEGDLEFDLRIILRKGEYNYTGGANSGEDLGAGDEDPYVEVVITLPEDFSDWEELSMHLKDLLRHEIEHLKQGGINVRPGGWMEDDAVIRKLIGMEVVPEKEYYKLAKEVDAMIQGIWFQAKKSRRPLIDVAKEYLESQKVSLKDQEEILSLWSKRLPALGVPKDQQF